MSKKLFDQFNSSRLMLPQHREYLHRQRRLQQLAEENPLPVIDEQQWDEFQRILEQSLREKIEIGVTVWTKEKRLRWQGKAVRLDSATGLVHLATAQGIKKIRAQHLLSIVPLFPN